MDVVSDFENIDIILSDNSSNSTERTGNVISNSTGKGDTDATPTLKENISQENEMINIGIRGKMLGLIHS